MVEANAYGEPAQIVVQGRFVAVRTIHDQWRIDDEWWRDEISRRYFALELENGRRITVYYDQVSGTWFAQGYDGPRKERSMLRAPK